MLGVGELRIRSLNGLTIHLVSPSSIVSEYRDGLSNIFIQSLLVRLSIIPRVYRREDVTVLFAKVTELPQ